MSSPADSNRRYDDLYSEFDSPLMRQLRVEAYGRDIGQHSWTTAEELEAGISQLNLSAASRILDLGCGPGGPLCFVVGLVGCHGHGIDRSAEAIAAGRARAAALQLDGLIVLHEGDLNRPIPLPSRSFDAVISLDVVLHLRDRAEFFREVTRMLVPGGRFLFTDAGVVTASISNEEIARRAFHGYTQFVPAGFNERMLELAGLRLLDRTDCTANLVRNATGRSSARLAHRTELQRIEGRARFERQQRYLQTVIELSRRGAMSRIMYCAAHRAA